MCQYQATIHVSRQLVFPSRIKSENRFKFIREKQQNNNRWKSFATILLKNVSLSSLVSPNIALMANDHIGTSVLDIRILIDCDVTMASIIFYLPNDLFDWMDRRRAVAFEWFDFQLPITALCSAVRNATAKRSPNWGHFYLLIMIFVVRRRVPKRDRTTEQLQFMRSTAVL